MKLAALFEAPKKPHQYWNDGAKEGYLAVLDPEGNWSPEAVYAFNEREDAKACEAFLKQETKGSDSYVKFVKVDEYFIVIMTDHRADLDEVHPLGFGQSQSSLEERLRKDVEDDELNVDMGLFDETVVFARIRHNGQPA